MAAPVPKCPVRGEPCTLCQPGVEGPQECGLVYLVMDDPELKELWVQQVRRQSAARVSSPQA